MSTLTAPLRGFEPYEKLVQELQSCPCAVTAEGCVDAQKLHLIHALSQEPALRTRSRFRLILTYSDQRARQIRDANLFYDRTTVLFPAKDLIFYQADLRGKELDKERISCLRRLVEGRPTTIVTTFSALMTPQVPLAELQKSVIEVEKGEEISLTETARKLAVLGYEKNYQVERPGQFAIRGDILDIFELTQDNPYRIELWGDEVESIRSFDVLSQRSVENLSSVRIFPATDMILSDRRLRDGLLRVQKEADETEEKYIKQGMNEEAHRLRTNVKEMIESAQQWREYGALESYIHYFYPATENFSGPDARGGLCHLLR